MSTQEPAGELSWFSDEALRKQAAARRYTDAGQRIPLELLAGLLAPRTQPAAEERCASCGSDAREQVGGAQSRGVRWCDLCLDRGRDEDYETAGADDE